MPLPPVMSVLGPEPSAFARLSPPAPNETFGLIWIFAARKKLV